MIRLPSDSRTQEPTHSGSDYQSRAPLLAGRRNSYRLQYQGIEDPPSYDATMFQENSTQRSLDENGYSRHPTVWRPSSSHYETPRSFSHYEVDIDRSNVGLPEIPETEVQSMGPSPELSLKPRPPKAVLKRGLQIPTRISYITSGFRLPPTLCDAGVDRARWKAFTREVKGYGSMSKSQWASMLGINLAVGIIVDFVVPGAGQLVVVPVLNHKGRRNKERDNFRVAFASGGLQMVAEKWNRELFEPLGVQVRIEPPNCFVAKDMSTMDVSSSKLFKYQEKKGLHSSSTSGCSEFADKKAMKYAGKEGKYRRRAARKGRILIFPFQPGTNQAKVDEPAAVSSGTGYTILPVAGPSSVLHAVQLCAAATGVAVHLQALTS